LRETLDNFSIGETAWTKMLSEMVSYFEKVGQRALSSIFEAGPAVKDLKTLLGNAACRQEMFNVLDCAASFASWPGEPGELLEEWRAKRASGDGQASSLRRIVALLQSQNTLGKCSLVLGDSSLLSGEAGTLTVYLENGDTVQKFQATFVDARSLPAALQHSRLSQMLGELLRQSFQLAVDKLVESFVFGVFRSNTVEECAMQGDMTVMLVRLVDKSLAGDQLKQVTKVFANPAKKDCLWPSVTWRLLVEEMMTVVPDAAFAAALLAGPALGSQTLRCTSKEHFSKWIALHDGMAQVALCLVFCRSRYFGNEPAEPCCGNGLLKPEAVAAVTTAREILSDARMADLKDICFETADFAKYLKMSLPECQSWLGKAAFVVRGLVYQQLQAAAALADEVSKVTPKYDHVITSETIHHALAKKHLAGWPSKDILNSKTVLLHQALASFRQRHAAWQLSPVLAADTAWQEELGNVNVVFDSAKLAIATMAAVNVMLMPKNKDQAEAATVFLLKNRDSLAKSLVQALEGIVAAFAVQAPAAKKPRNAKEEQ
jgi:hypothetical protein